MVYRYMFSSWLRLLYIVAGDHENINTLKVILIIPNEQFLFTSWFHIDAYIHTHISYRTNWWSGQWLVESIYLVFVSKLLSYYVAPFIRSTFMHHSFLMPTCGKSMRYQMNGPYLICNDKNHHVWMLSCYQEFHKVSLLWKVIANK